jgi:predicted tellurium resistance membrane protein TerC
MEWITTPEAWTALATLTLIEIVLGIDNIVFISILVGRLQASQQQKARIIGLSLAMGTRLALLFSLTWFMRVTWPLFEVLDRPFSIRDLILIGGGLFLLAKATLEIHDKLEGTEGHSSAKVAASFGSVLLQIALLDMVFSLDSVITAVGLAQQIEVMVAAIVIAVIVMMISAKTISEFIGRHPTIKMLALSFLLLIGLTLVGEGFGLHIPKGYIYFAMAFSIFVELLNMRIRTRRAEPISLRKAYVEPANAGINDS